MLCELRTWTWRILLTNQIHKFIFKSEMINKIQFTKNTKYTISLTSQRYLLDVLYQKMQLIQQRISRMFFPKSLPPIRQDN